MPLFTQDGRSLRAQKLRDQRRAEILVAAAAVFAKKGYEAGSIADVIEAAGIARGTFYLHFQSKQAIVGELLDDLLATLDGVIFRVTIDSDVSPYEQLIQNLEGILRVLDERLDVTRILLGGTHPGDLAPRVQKFWDDSLKLLRGSILTGLELGILRDVDADLVCYSILGGLKETVQRTVLAEGAPVDRRELARKLLDLHLHGVLLHRPEG